MPRRVPIPGVCAHARDRMAERLGRDLTRAEWLEAVARIVDRRALLLCLMPDGAEHFLHELGEVRLRLVWRPALGAIVTVLPAEAPPAALVDRVVRETRLRQTFTRAPWKRGQRTARRTVWVQD